MHTRIGAIRLSLVGGMALVLLLANMVLAAPVASVVRVLATPNPAVNGTAVTFTAGVNWTATDPATGTITINDTCAGATSPVALGTITLGSASSSSPGAGSLVVSSFPCTGQNSIVAVYGGDSEYSAGSSQALTQTVVAHFAPSTTSLSSTPNPSAPGQAVTFTAQLGYTLTGNTRPTGMVTFTNTGAGTVLCTGPVQTSGGTILVTTASCSTAALAAGSYLVQATYAGDSVYASSTSPTVTQVVGQGNAAASTTSLSSSATQIQAGQPVTFTAQVSSSGSTPGGSVTFQDGTTALGTVGLNAAGTATLTNSSLAGGTHTITAAYGGSTNFAPSTSAPVTLTVQSSGLQSTTITLTASSNPAGAGASIAVAASVRSTSGTPSGTVSFQDNSSTPAAVLGTSMLQNGVATLTIALAPGTHALSASYSGDNSFSSSVGTFSEIVNATAVQFTAAIPHLAFGVHWKTTILLRDESDTPANVTISYFGDDGSAIQVPTATGTASQSTVTIPAHGQIYIDTNGGGADQAAWAGLTFTDTGVKGQGVFLWQQPNGGYSEAATPMISSAGTSGTMPFDNTGSSFSGYAFSNNGTTPTTLRLQAFDDSGNPLGQYSQQLPAFGHTSFLLADHLPQIQGKRGVLQITGSVQPMGFKFIEGGTRFTTWLP